MRTLVLGGYGAVGTHVVNRLRHRGLEAVTGGRDPRRTDRVLDVRDPHSLRAALAEVDVVVNASGHEDRRLAEIVTGSGAALVDITATSSYVAALEQLRLPRPVLLSVGLAPGLSTLLAAFVHAGAPGPVDLAILLGAGERHGPAAVEWTRRLLGRSAADPGTGRPVRNLTEPRTFTLPGYGRRRLHRADFSDQHTLTRDLGAPVRSHLGLDSRLATLWLTALTRIPSASRFPLHRLPATVFGDDGWCIQARAADGTTRSIRGRHQSHATAVVTEFAALRVHDLAPGVHHLHHVATLDDLPTDLIMPGT